MTIGSAKECDGLYYFEEPIVSKQGQLTVCDSISVIRDSYLQLWHFRMGHPNSQYLRHLFPSLFLNKKPVEFQCEFCEFAKHHRSSFPSSNYKSSKPFTMIHSDLWGPSRIPNRTHTK